MVEATGRGVVLHVGGVTGASSAFGNVGPKDDFGTLVLLVLFPCFMLQPVCIFSGSFTGMDRRRPQSLGYFFRLSA